MAGSGKEPRDHTLLLINGITDPKKTNGDLQRSLAPSGVVIDTMTVGQLLLDFGRKARNPIKKQLLVIPIMERNIYPGQGGTKSGMRKSGERLFLPMKHIFKFKNMCPMV